jgi:DNA-binding response OmpR family regulator
MADFIENNFDAVADAACQAMQALLDQPDVEIVDQHEFFLNRFSELAATEQRFEQLGEMARSVASLLNGKSGLYLDRRTYLQILAVGPKFIEALNPLTQKVDARRYRENSLVAAVTPTSSNLSKEVLVLTNSDGFWGLLNTVSLYDGFVPRRLRVLDGLIQKKQENPPAAIILDIDLMTDQAALNILAELRRTYYPTSHLFILGEIANFDARLLAVRIGATRYFSKPPDVRRIVSVLKGVTIKEPTEPFRVMLVDDDKSMARIYEKALSKAGFSTHLITNPLDAMQSITAFKPDLIVTDLLMSGCNGLEFLSVIRQDDSLLDIPVVVMTSDNDPARKIEALNLGADNYLVKPVAMPLLIATITAHAKKSRRLKRNRFNLHDVIARLKTGKCATCGEAPLRDLRKSI